MLTKSKPEPVAETPPEDLLPARLGPSVHTYGRLRKHAAISTLPRLSAAPSTTNQARILNTAVVGTPGTDQGIAIGDDQLSGAVVYHDVFTAYAAKLISSPNGVIVGGLGTAKSALAKTNYVLRPLMLADRRAVVVDKKPLGEDGDGEYSEPTRTWGVEPYKMLPGDPESTCLNILDPLILAAGDRPNRAAGANLLTAMAELAGTGPLDTLEHAALTAAHKQLLCAFEDRRVPVIEDLLKLLPGIVNAPEFAARRPATLDAVDLAALNVELRMRRMLADDLAGMFDGETSKHVALHPKLTTFNISNLPEDGPATAMVIAVVNALLMGMLRRHRDGKKTTFLAEEAWTLLLGSAAKNVRANLKLARALGLSMWFIIHHISDVIGNPDALAILKEAGTAHLFRQEREDDIADCVRIFGLDPSNADVLRTLPQGQHLFKLGTAPEVHIRAHRTAAEVLLTETDEAMLARPTAGSVA